MKLLSFVVSCLMVLSGAWAQAEVEATCGDFEIRAGGLTPGADAVVFGVAVSREGPVKRISQPSGVVEADGTGSIRWEEDDGVPQMSIWAVVDVSTGDFDRALPEGMPDNYLLDGNGDPLTQGQIVSGRITGGIAEAAFLVVRPGVGAWRLHVGDGGASDSDGATDGSIRVKMNDLKPLREDWGPLRNIRPGDTIVIIDPRNMAYLAERVGH
jgi:hypothetical protein